MVRGSAWLRIPSSTNGMGIGCCVALSLAIGCGGNSQRHGGSGAAANAARGGGASAGMDGSGGATSGMGGDARGGNAGTNSSPMGGTGVSAGGSSGAAMAGAPNPGGGLGGASGEGSVNAGMAGGAGRISTGGAGGGAGGDAAGGADDGGASGCLELCTADAPMCCTAELQCVKAVPTCRIDILDGLVVDTPYHYPDLEAAVAKYSGDVVMSIGDIDVGTALVDPAPSARIELDLSAQASELHGPGLEVLQNRAFRFSCSDQLLFLGLIYNRNGAAAIQAPVMHVEEADDGRVTLLIGSSLGVWTGVGLYPAPELNAVIDRPELRAAFCARGVLGQLEPR